jgi:coproporphyrinogen III oxidase-like Fe-S oxidoreductase
MDDAISNRVAHLLQVVGDRPGAADQAAEPYVALVLREIRATRAALGDSAVPNGGLDTIFFGGGTPSLCPPKLMGEIIEALRREFGIAADAEICAEVCLHSSTCLVYMSGLATQILSMNN